jgi:CHAT domain-containing protein
MDEHRIQAYERLIHQLLGCPKGQEAELLQANVGLVDAGLVQTIGTRADILEREGDTRRARWLREFIVPLGQILGLTIMDTSGQMWDLGRMDRVNFLLASLDLILRVAGDPIQVYSVWEQQKILLDEALIPIMPQAMKYLLRNKSKDKKLIGMLFNEFGCLVGQFRAGSQRSNLELARAAFYQSLEVITRKALPLEWAMVTHNLANTYSDRAIGSRAKNLEKAIKLYGQALKIRTKKKRDIEWADTIQNLAKAYSDRVIGSRAENLEKAIDLCRQALTVRTKEERPVEWATTTLNLATVYRDRVKKDRSENMEKCIDLCRKSLEVMEQKNIYGKCRASNNLAVAYIDRARGERQYNLKCAISALNQALSWTDKQNSFELARIWNNLGIAYSQLCLDSRAENIEKAIQFYRQALRLRRTIPIEFSETLRNLALAYLDRVEGSRSMNIEMAIKACKQSLRASKKGEIPIEWARTAMNLGNAYKNRIRGDRTENINQAISCYRQAFKIFVSECLPHDSRKAARNLGNCYLGQKHWAEASDAYSRALQVDKDLYQSAALLTSKAVELSEAPDIYCNVAYAYARTDRNLYPQAVEALEQSRARALSESLDRDRTNLDQLKEKNEPLYTQYKDIIQQLRNLEATQRAHMTSDDRHSITPEAVRNEITHLREKRTTTIAQIRRQPGYETFLTLPTFEDVQKVVTPDRALTYLLSTPAGSVALVVTLGDIHSIWLNDFTETQLAKLLQTWFAAYNNSSSDCQTWLDTIDQTTRQLWAPLMGPLVQKLQDLEIKRITLIPTGYLSLLPLHAAWTEIFITPTSRYYATDAIHITYAPNAKSLTAAQAIVQSLNDHGQDDTILAIDEPHHRILDSTTGEYKPIRTLPSSSTEVESAIATFQSSHRILQHNQATREAVLDALPHATILHCSCHGNAKPQEPLKSGLAMAGDGEAAVLTVRDFLDLKLTDGDRGGLRLAILSACETGLPGLDNIDEVISLPVGLMQAGVAGVIASLWSVSDLSTMLLLTKFYDLWRKHGLEPDQALRKAQIWLRDSTAGEIAATGLLFIPPGTSPDVVQSCPYAHPYRWAAFSYTGL